MKTIVHFSDIHFGGPQAPNRAEAILEEIERRRPTVVAVSGDLTQRARTDQFRQAREFLDRISAPLVVVPGNHDVPLWDIYSRFVSPLGKYKRWITPDLNPLFIDPELVVMGLDTTRSFTIKGGEIEGKDLGAVKARICELGDGLCRVLVAHHPLGPTPGQDEDIAGGARRALRFFAECGVDMVLTGHAHESHTASSKEVHPETGRGILLVQAGTLASLRGRGKEQLKNSYNLIEISAAEITVTSHVYSDEPGRFIADVTTTSPRHS